jgi:hypothetical protein
LKCSVVVLMENQLVMRYVSCAVWGTDIAEPSKKIRKLWV